MDMIEKIEGSGDEEDTTVLDKVNPIKAREKYRQERLAKIKEMRDNEVLVAGGTTLEELKNKPSNKEIKLRPLVQKSEELKAEAASGVAEKGGYM